ncbi:hypothetical protein EG68_08342 [Paragonimus skrjabini miyazakii]|uniref:Uncharacterized protein n=1 Tax=Paragonimus skrjabini miyazakii TaxID=59628 RepID=A0A8S9YT91_9TREM|nr:hypothetical protein EG68_08342 [Paragonimus skrjabini miyazakii]
MKHHHVKWRHSAENHAMSGRVFWCNLKRLDHSYISLSLSTSSELSESLGFALYTTGVTIVKEPISRTPSSDD